MATPRSRADLYSAEPSAIEEEIPVTSVDLTDGVRVLGVPRRERSPGIYERRLKRAVDILGSMLLLVITAPLFAICAVAILTTMGGPVLLRQDRVGLDGELFTMYKFRSMIPDRRAAQQPYVGQERRLSHKRPNDPRITPVGSVIRKWSLDELPQLINVVRGEMSLVGPRPELIPIVLSYEPWQLRRLQVRPGITGLWQISERGDIPMHHATEIDLEYVERISLGFDLILLLKTPLAAFGSRKGF